MKNKEGMKQLNIEVPEELHRELKIAACKTSVTLTEWATNALLRSIRPKGNQKSFGSPVDLSRGNELIAA